MSDDEDYDLIDAGGLCSAPVYYLEIDPDMHDRLGFDHHGGPAPELPVADE